jgi:hypothetical protein
MEFGKKLDELNYTGANIKNMGVPILKIWDVCACH